MKALKEKRISLRSLWRRGLVILSLFALVFASCGESSGGDDEGGTVVASGKTPYGIEVITNPTNDCYQGLPLDFTGIKLLVRYTDGTVAYVTDADASKFTTYPKWATGGYVSSSKTFYPLYQYYLYYEEAGKIFSTTISIKDVIPLYREDGSQVVSTPVDPVTGQTTGVYYTSNGLQMTGVDTRAVTKMYVDDKPNFGGITLEGDYRKRNAAGNVYDPGAAAGVKKVIPLTLELDWRIIPYYNNGNATGRGGLYVTIGRNPLELTDGIAKDNYKQDGTKGQDLTAITMTPTGSIDPGVTAISPLDEVWHVTKIEIEAEPELKPFFYWDDDVPNTTTKISPWVARVREGEARIKVTYSNEGTKSFSIPELEYQNTVWLNATPSGVSPVIPSSTWLPFDVKGILWERRRPTCSSTR